MEWLTVGLEMGGSITFGRDEEEGSFLRFTIGEDREWGYSHKLYVTEDDMNRLIDGLYQTKQQPYESVSVAPESIR